MQSRARRSYNAVVIPTDALLTFGILKLTSLMLKSVRTMAMAERGLYGSLSVSGERPHEIFSGSSTQM